jgi:hypothetical protein
MGLPAFVNPDFIPELGHLEGVSATPAVAGCPAGGDVDAQPYIARSAASRQMRHAAIKKEPFPRRPSHDQSWRHCTC